MTYTYEKSGAVIQVYRKELLPDGVRYLTGDVAIPPQETPHDRYRIDFSAGKVVLVPGTAPPIEEHQYTALELAQQDITDLQLADIEQGQAITDLDLKLLEVQTIV